MADAVGCSVGVVGESKAWKLNRQRLKIARLHGIDPKATKLDEHSVNAAGGSRMRQLHASRQEACDVADEIDQREHVLFGRIGDYLQAHPDATPEEVASAIGCAAVDVERREEVLKQLAAQQARDRREDSDVEAPDKRRGAGQKRVRRRV